MRKYLLTTIGFITALLIPISISFAQSIPTISPWKVLGGIISPVVNTNSLKVPSLGSPATSTVVVGPTGLFSTSTASSGSGGIATSTLGSPNTLAFWSAQNTLGATSSPTVGYITGTSTSVLSRFGSAFIGSWPGNSTYALFGNTAVDESNLGNYSFLAGPNGDTYVNSASGQPIKFGENNMVIATLSTSSHSTGQLTVGTTTEGVNVISLFGNNPDTTVTGGNTQQSLAIINETATNRAVEGINLYHRGSFGLRQSAAIKAVNYPATDSGDLAFVTWNSVGSANEVMRLASSSAVLVPNYIVIGGPNQNNGALLTNYGDTMTLNGGITSWRPLDNSYDFGAQSVGSGSGAVLNFGSAGMAQLAMTMDTGGGVTFPFEIISNGDVTLNGTLTDSFSSSGNANDVLTSLGSGSGTEWQPLSSLGVGTVTSIATNSSLSGGTCTTTCTLAINLTNANTWTGQQIFRTANVGIGTTSPYSMLSVAGQVVAQNYVATSTTATSTIGLGGLAIGTTTPSSNSLFTIGTSSPLFYVDRMTGNVSIGTTSPNAKLQINTANISGTSIGASGIETVGTNLSIITTNAQAADVGGMLSLGGMRDNAATDPGIFGGIRGGKENATTANRSGYLGFYTLQGGVAFAERMRITSTGNVGIGTSTPDSALDANGSVRLEGASTITTPSISGAIVGLGCDSVTNTVSPPLASTTVFITTPQTYPGAGLTWSSYLSGSTTITTQLCSDVTITPTASIYNVKIIK